MADDFITALFPAAGDIMMTVQQSYATGTGGGYECV